jgi:hypothetical protein
MEPCRMVVMLCYNLRMKKKLVDDISMKGTVKLTNFFLDNPRALYIDKILEQDGIHPDVYAGLVAELRKLCTTQSIEKHNLVVLSGREVVARLLFGDPTYTGEINYGLLGTGDTAVDASDISLEAEVFRRMPSRKVRTGASIAYDFFYSKGSVAGTFEEFGLTIDGTGEPGSGQLYNRVLTGGWVKSASVAMTIEFTLSVNA